MLLPNTYYPWNLPFQFSRLLHFSFFLLVFAFTAATRVILPSTGFLFYHLRPSGSFFCHQSLHFAHVRVKLIRRSPVFALKKRTRRIGKTWLCLVRFRFLGFDCFQYEKKRGRFAMCVCIEWGFAFFSWTTEVPLVLLWVEIQSVRKFAKREVSRQVLCICLSCIFIFLRFYLHAGRRLNRF